MKNEIGWITPNRFNPSSLSKQGYAAEAVKCAQRHADFQPSPTPHFNFDYNEYVFIDRLRFAWSLCYTREMRLADAAYDYSNL